MTSPAAAPPTVVSVNVGTPRTVEWRGRPVTTAIWKSPVHGPVPLAGVNLAGDDQADRRVHGGPDKAVYAYATEDYAWWATAWPEGPGAGEPLAPGTFGENLTTTGLDLTGASIGDRWHVGDAVLEVAGPRQPCFKLGIRMGDDGFPDRFEEAGRPGAYLRIVRPGSVQAGDTVRVEPAAPPHITVGALVQPEPPDELLELAAADDRVPANWRRHAARALRDRAGSRR
ncbi:MAG TPA: MOSC domain-containing protein [Acidimicrobiales bacterium]